MIERVLFITRGGERPSGETRRGFWHRLRRRAPASAGPFTGQDGFFRGSLHAVCSVTERPLSALRADPARVEADFHALVVSAKCGDAGVGATRADLDCVARVGRIPKVLLEPSASAGHLPGDDVLDLFDLVFKREPYRDRGRYPVAPSNRDKLCPTMLACPLVPATADTVRTIAAAGFGFPSVSRELEWDVFFSGKTTWPEREVLWARVARENLRLRGGLQPRRGGADVAPELAFPALGKKDYVDAIRRSRINLALEGYGEFTRRHLEIWALCAFLLSSPSVRELELPMQAVEGLHYACFEDADDLIDKVRHFIARDDARERIAQAGRALFERAYSFTDHGAFIRSCIEAL